MLLFVFPDCTERYPLKLTVQVLLHALGEAAEHGELDGLAGEDGRPPVKVGGHEGCRDVGTHRIQVHLTALLAHPTEKENEN